MSLGDTSPYDNKHSDEIDPRTYFYLRSHLDEIYQKAKANDEIPKFSCATTWLMNNDDMIRNEVQMPLFTNNCDVVVNTNTIFGVSSLLL